MKSPAKIFLVFVWMGIIGGAAWGWWQAAHSGNIMLSMLQKTQVGLSKNAASTSDFSGDADSFDNQFGQEPIIEGVTDLSCVETLQQQAQHTIEQYVAEKGYPTQKINLQKDYDKTPDALKQTFTSGAACGVQDLSCDTALCRYSVYVMQKQDGYSTMAVSLSGMLFAHNAQGTWNTNCFSMTEEGKAICDQYNSPLPVETVM